jgi:hypothetical protein
MEDDCCPRGVTWGDAVASFAVELIADSLEACNWRCEVEKCATCGVLAAPEWPHKHGAHACFMLVNI